MVCLGLLSHALGPSHEAARLRVLLVFAIPGISSSCRDDATRLLKLASRNGLKCQPWFSMRLVAYSFLGARGTQGLETYWILTLEPERLKNPGGQRQG